MNFLICVLLLLGVARTSYGRDNGDRSQSRGVWQRRVSFNADNAEDSEDEASVPTPEDPDGDGVIGAAGKDYPVLREAPSGATNFDCDGRLPGMYADVDSGCQVYHVCQADRRKESGLCVNGTIFNQETFSCDWWYNVDCSKAPDFYALNVHLGKPYTPPAVDQRTRQASQQQKQQHRHLDIHPERQFLRRKMTAPQLPQLPTMEFPSIFPPSIELPPAPILQAPPRVRVNRKKPRRPSSSSSSFKVGLRDQVDGVPQEIDLQLPVLPTFPTLILSDDGNSAPRRNKQQQKQQQRVQRPRPDGAFNNAGGQYLRDVFDPALHLPRPNPLSLKKLAAKQRQRATGSSRDQSMKPMMFPVKSEDTVAGYSDLYLNKPVDED